MAACDYYSCDVCSAKTFYDASMDYDDKMSSRGALIPNGAGDMAVICDNCAKTHFVVIQERIGLSTPESKEEAKTLLDELDEMSAHVLSAEWEKAPAYEIVAGTPLKKPVWEFKVITEGYSNFQLAMDRSLNSGWEIVNTFKDKELHTAHLKRIKS